MNQALVGMHAQVRGGEKRREEKRDMMDSEKKREREETVKIEENKREK